MQKRKILHTLNFELMKRFLHKTVGWFMTNHLPQNTTHSTCTQLPDDPLDTYPTRKLTYSKWIATILLFFVFSISVSAQSLVPNLDGLWILKELQGNDTARVLTPAEIEKSTKNYLHDFPLTTTSLKFSGNEFVMTHHVGGVMNGTFDVRKNVLTLHVSSCSTCGDKDFVFLIRKQTQTEFLLDMFEEDEGSTNYVRLTFERNNIVNNVNQK